MLKKFYQYEIGPDSGVNDGAAQRHDKHGRVDDEEGAYPRVHLGQVRAAGGLQKFCSLHKTNLSRLRETRPRMR